jgi:hypothetical protein
VNAALVALAGTVTVAGSVTAVLLLNRVTVSPPLAAAAFSVTVQASVPEPVMDPLVQVSVLNTAAAAIPVPLRLIASEVPLVPLLLLVMARLPVAAPTRVGSNFTLKVVDCPGFSVTGKVAPDTVKPVPFSVGALIVKAKLPVDANVRDCVAAVFTSTLPNDTLAALVLRIRVAASNCSVNVFETLPALAFSVTACAV